MSSRAYISLASACPRPIQEVLHISRGVSRAGAANKSNFGLPQPTMGAAGTAGAAHTLALAPRAPESPAPYANISFSYDRGSPLSIDTHSFGLIRKCCGHSYLRATSRAGQHRRQHRQQPRPNRAAPGAPLPHCTTLDLQLLF